MNAFIPAPSLVQFADEELIIEIGAVVFPGFVVRLPNQNGLYLRMKGDYTSDALIAPAAERFQTLLGLLRACLPSSGERADEIRPGIGRGTIRDDFGNQVVLMNTVVDYGRKTAQIDEYAQHARSALEKSEPLRNALWLNGRRDRNAADYFMIYEYAKKDFKSPCDIANNLGVSGKDLKRLTRSANNLAPRNGGRHSTESEAVDWSLDEQREFIGLLLRRWIAFRGKSEMHHVSNS